MGEPAEFWLNFGCRNQMKKTGHWALAFQIGVRRLTGQGIGIDYEIGFSPPDEL
jgi:hypothetical protein